MMRWFAMAAAAFLVAGCGSEDPADSERAAAEALAEAERLAALGEDWEDDADGDEDDDDGADGVPAQASAAGWNADGTRTHPAAASSAGARAFAPSPAQAGSGAAGPQNILRFEPAVVIDATGFDRPLAASTLFVPYGWRSEGGVLWGSNFLCTNGYVFNWAATSPDGSEQIAILPQERWENNNYGAAPSTPGCSSAPYSNVRQYLEGLAQRWRPGARALDFRPRNDIAAEFKSLNQSTPTAMGEIRTWVEAGELLFAYQDRGREMRGVVAAATVFNLMRSSNGMGGSMDALTGATFPAWGATAPNGRLNLARIEAIRKTIRPGPEWSRRITNHNVQIGRVALEESRKRSEAVMRSNEEISRIRQEAWSSYQESADRRAREFGELMKGVETYTDANAPGGQVELSANYNHAWRLRDGSYVLTNDASFDPWRDLRLEGEQLGPVR